MSRMELGKKILVFACWSGSYLTGGCGEKQPEIVAAAPSSSHPAAPSTRAVPTVSVSPRSEDALTVSGPLIVEHEVDVTAQRDGIISSIFTDAGIRVKG
ncbi:MAG TPA: hypothetical protein VGI46_08605, partial [Candidatus Acidoferrum sp.]